MTQPHLMNCSHSPDGWCLACVRELYDIDKERDLINREYHLTHELNACPTGDVIVIFYQGRIIQTRSGKTSWKTVGAAKNALLRNFGKLSSKDKQALYNLVEFRKVL
jgi:hypothetical protein